MDDIHNNFLKRRPIRVVWIGRSPSKSDEGADLPGASASNSQFVIHVFCFIGSRLLPKYVKDAINKIIAAIGLHGAASKEVREACGSKDLQDYLGCGSGNEVSRVLGLSLASTVKRVLSNQSRAVSAYTGARRVREQPAPEDDAELTEIERLLSEDIDEGAQAAPAAQAAQDMASKTSQLAQTERAPQFIADGITFIDDVAMYPEDSFMDVKRKIFISTKIPIYRQHVAAWNEARDNGAEITGPTISYNLFTTGSHMVDFRDLYAPAQRVAEELAASVVSLFGVPIDRSIYDSREDLRVEAKDHILTIDNVRPDFFIVFDLASWITPVLEQIRAALIDNYQFEMLYYGFIVKYFPQLTRECFHAYVTNESEMPDKFPDLAPILTTVRASMIAQCQISNNVYAYVAKPRTDIDHIILRASVTSIRPGTIVLPINLRDFFDSIACSATILDVRAIIDSSTSKTQRDVSRFELRKFFKSSALMSATSGQIGAAAQSPACSQLRKFPSLGGEPGLVVLFILNGLPMFMIVRPSGRFTFQFQWNEEDEIDFGTMAKLFKKHTDVLIKELRKGGVFAAGNIEPISDSNLSVQSLTVAMRWKRTLSTRQFRLLREMWGEYIRAGIVIPHQTSKDIFSFIFTRGMSSIDMRALEMRLAAANIIETNHYAYLSVSAMRQKWIQNFAGRTVNVNHRATDVRFDVLDIYEHEYQIFEAYLGAFITNYERTHGSASAEVAAATEATMAFGVAPERRRLRRLQEIDPELYNLKKHGAPRVFAQKCQGSKQPVLYSEHEKIPRGAVKYWNFTKNRPAFYTCPDPKYPHLNFIVNAHPRGYCIPCCGKMKPTAGSKHATIERICIENHSYDVSQLVEQPISYVMSFGKDLPEGRFSNLPAGYLRDTLNRAASAMHAGAELLIFGVPQTLSIVHTLRAILDLSISDFVEGITGGLEKNIIEFETLANGRAATYFASKRAFIGYLASIAGGGITFPEGTSDFMRIVLTDCARIVYGLEMIYLLTADKMQNMRIIVRQKMENEREITAQTKIGLAVIGQDKSINPVLIIHPEDFARNGSVASRTLIPECIAILYQIVHGFEQHHMKSIDLTFIRTYARELGHIVHKLYVGLRGLCYAVQLRESAKAPAAYIPIIYSSDIQKKPEEEVAFDSLDDTIQLEACLRVIDKINELIVHKHLAYYKMVIEKIVTVADKPIGLIVRTGIEAIMYFSCSSAAMPDVPRRNLAIDPRKHARMLLAQGTSVNTLADYEGSVIARIAHEAANRLYPYHEYELFCVQFMARTQTLRNEKVRKRIRDIIESGQSAAAKSQALHELSLSRHDYGILTKALQERTTKYRRAGSILQELRATLDADLDEMYKHINEDEPSVLAQWIQKFMEPAIIREDATPAQVPSIISPCSKSAAQSDPNKPHCSSSGQLIIRSSIETLSELLAADLQNPLKRTYIFARSSYPESRAAFADFTQRPSEILIVKKYTIQP